MSGIKKRNPISVLVLSFITLGIYGIYWVVKTKEEINSLGARIPTAWLFVVPIVNIYFVYKYAQGFSRYVRKDNRPILWFLLYMLLLPVSIVLFQSGLNKASTGKTATGSSRQETTASQRVVAMFVLFSLGLPFFANANAINYWRDDQASYEYCSNFMPIAAGLIGGLIFPPLSVAGVELGVIGCDVFHKKFDWVGTADRATGRVFSNPTSAAGFLTPAIPLVYTGYKLVTGGVSMAVKEGMNLFTPPQEKNQSQSQVLPSETTKQKNDTAVVKPPESKPEQNAIAPKNQPQKISSEVQATQGKVTALVISPDGQPVYQATFSLVDDKGNYAGKYLAGIASDVTRYTEKKGELETAGVPSGRYTLRISCGTHCMFGDNFATNIANDIYARWSKEVSVDINKSQIDLGKIELKKWTRVTFTVATAADPNSSYPAAVKIKDINGNKIDNFTSYTSASGYTFYFPDGTYYLVIDESPYYKILEKQFSVNGDVMDLGKILLEK